MVTNNDRSRVARDLRELATDCDEVDEFDLARALDLEATSRTSYDAEDVLRLADLIDPEDSSDPGPRDLARAWGWK